MGKDQISDKKINEWFSNLAYQLWVKYFNGDFLPAMCDLV